MPITEKDKIDGLKHISKIHRSQFDERRKIEWKIVFTIIAFFFGIIATSITKELKLIQYGSYFILGISVLCKSALGILRWGIYVGIRDGD